MMPRALPFARNQQCKAKTRTPPPRFFSRPRTTFASLSNPCVVPALRPIFQFPPRFFQECPIAPPISIRLKVGFFAGSGVCWFPYSCDVSQPRKKTEKWLLMTFLLGIQFYPVRGYEGLPPRHGFLFSFLARVGSAHVLYHAS